jgi:hypothetical protein
MEIVAKFIMFLIGFIIFMIVSGPSANTPNRIDKWLGISTSLVFKIPVLSIKIHLHHWLCLLIISLLVKSQRIVWFCYGGAVQGIIMYKDFYRIIYFYK